MGRLVAEGIAAGSHLLIEPPEDPRFYAAHLGRVALASAGKSIGRTRMDRLVVAFCGRQFGSAEPQLICAVAKRCAGLSRMELAHTGIGRAQRVASLGVYA